MINLSIIIPFKNDTESLFRLFDSIPKRDDIEIILVENSDSPLTKEQIGIDRDYILLNADSARYAGGARNVGLENAQGEWLVFADSDDFFTYDAFDKISVYLNSGYDLVYFGCNSVYADSMEQSDRHIFINNNINGFLDGSFPEMRARLYHVVPWAKMIRRSLVEEFNIRFDEVIAANDVYFSTLVGYYAKSFHTDCSHIYVVTTRKGSLANTWNIQILRSRYHVALKRNKFLKEHALGHLQVSVMIYLYKALRLSVKTFFQFIHDAITYRQNIFIGWSNWLSSFQNLRSNNKKNKEYIIDEK
mgnify:CR=1 FL=1